MRKHGRIKLLLLWSGLRPSRITFALRDIWRRVRNQVWEYKDIVWFPAGVVLLAFLLMVEGGCQGGNPVGLRFAGFEEDGSAGRVIVTEEQLNREGR